MKLREYVWFKNDITLDSYPRYWVDVELWLNILGKTHHTFFMYPKKGIRF